MRTTKAHAQIQSQVVRKKIEVMCNRAKLMIDACKETVRPIPPWKRYEQDPEYRERRKKLSKASYWRKQNKK